MRAYGAVYKGAGINIINLQLDFGFKDVLAPLPTRPPIGVALSWLEIRNLQGVIAKPLEASHWHLQGISYHDFLLKIGTEQLCFPVSLGPLRMIRMNAFTFIGNRFRALVKQKPTRTVGALGTTLKERVYYILCLALGILNYLFLARIGDRFQLNFSTGLVS
jgi:hypothetical protein